MPFVAILLPVFVLMAAFAINVAHMELIRTELQISADAAVRAGSRTFADTGDTALARTIARNVASQNHVAGQPLLLDDADFEFGVSTRPNTTARYSFNPALNGFNSLRLTARRTTGSPSGPALLLLPNLLGISHFEPALLATSTQVELDIAIVVDRSGSMAYADNENSNTFNPPAAAPPGWNFGDAVPNPSRWDDTVAAVAAFLNVLNQTPQTELVSLTTYGDRALLDVDLTSNYPAILNGMDVYTQSFDEGLTNIGGGIDVGRRSLTTGPAARPWVARAVVVLTDGIHNTGTNPRSAARRAKRDGVTVYTVTFSREANKRRMQQVATIANGTHYHAQFRSDLIRAFQDIAKSLPTLIVQ